MDMRLRRVGVGDVVIIIVPGWTEVGAGGIWEKKYASLTERDQIRLPRVRPMQAQVNKMVV